MSTTSRVFLVILGVVVLLAVLMFVQRKKYPDGTFFHQSRTYYAERLNPDIGEKITTLVPGQTTTDVLVQTMGEPSDKVEADGLELWVYTMRIVEVTDRKLLGLVSTGGGTNAVESQMPVGVRDGMVVHTHVTPSEDPAVKKAIESMWDAYASGQ